MEAYWDRVAREDPYHFVDNRVKPGAPDLDAFWRGGEDVIDRLFAELRVELEGHEEVVEIGCGIGRLTRVLAGRAASVQALDISAEMLARARAHNSDAGNVNWIQGDGHSLAPLSESSADVCVSFVVFQHLPDPELTYGYVREMGRVLRPGGWAAFQVSNDPSVHARPPFLRRLRRRWATRRYDDPAWYGSAVETPALTEAAAGAGLEIERLTNQGTQFCHVLARRRA
jgi:SAM-dependent methyltransferase